MDLIQFVLVGDQRLVRFNQSATGERSQRSLKGYCLGDTKQEDDGINPYMKVRYRGIKKNANQVFTLCALSNLFVSRGRLLSTSAA